MDEHPPQHDDDLSDCERRLAGWHPASAGLDADAMLFAAGRAAGRRGRARLLWPALCVLLAVQAAGLGVWGLSERAERQALASRLPEPAPAPGAPSVTAVAASSYTPSPEDYFHLRRRLEQDPGRWPASPQPAGPRGKEPPPGPPPPEPAILRAGQRDGLLDP
jgi:hypothetical protein